MLGIRWAIVRKTLSDKGLTMMRRHCTTGMESPVKAVIHIRKLSNFGAAALLLQQQCMSTLLLQQ
ncbi:hypothetical protein RC55_17355 [Herbaspirillum seropedicae]|nr:hypothetical protein ACP92_04755 [Herbaspirillum seropedicae]NQE30989.1 hypothetical protein [Herbaspirillum seropedicae]